MSRGLERLRYQKWLFRGVFGQLHCSGKEFEGCEEINLQFDGHGPNARTICQTKNGANCVVRERKRLMRGDRSRIIIVIILIKLLTPLPTSSISLSTYIISLIKAQNTSPMVCDLLGEISDRRSTFTVGARNEGQA